MFAQWKVTGDEDGVTGDSDMGDHELAPLPDNHNPGDHGGHHGGYSDHDREMSYDREQKYMSKYHTACQIVCSMSSPIPGYVTKNLFP